MHTHKVVAQHANTHSHSVSASLMYAKAVGEVEKLALIKPAPVNPG